MHHLQIYRDHCTLHTYILEFCMKMLHDPISSSSYTEVLLDSYSTFDNHYVASDIEAPVNQFFSLVTALNIPNIKLNNGHVLFGGNFYYTRF